jgi:hypothetical protein
MFKVAVFRTAASPGIYFLCMKTVREGKVVSATKKTFKVLQMGVVGG